MANRGRTWRQAGIVGLYGSVAMLLFLPAELPAQVKGYGIPESRKSVSSAEQNRKLPSTRQLRG
jgi:hypothetical protein